MTEKLAYCIARDILKHTLSTCAGTMATRCPSRTPPRERYPWSTGSLGCDMARSGQWLLSLSKKCLLGYSDGFKRGMASSLACAGAALFQC